MLDFESRVPPVLRPSYRGALFILGMGLGWGGKLFALGVAAILVAMTGPLRGLMLMGELALAALVAGAIAGTIHGLLARAENWGRGGSWLRWTATIFGYVVAVGLLTVRGLFSLREPALYVLAAAGALLGAACLVLLDDRRPGRLSPRAFGARRNRERLWAAADRAWERREDAGLEPGAPRTRTAGDTAAEAAADPGAEDEEDAPSPRPAPGGLTWWTRS